MATLRFDATAVEPQQSGNSEPVPAGNYTVEVTNSEVKELKSGNGLGLSLEFTIINPAPFAHRKVWANINVEHTNEQTQSIGQSQLSALCRAVGISRMEDSDELFGRILRIRTKVREATGSYGPRAEVSGYESAGVTPPAARQAPPPAAAPAAAARPWAR